MSLWCGLSLSNFASALSVRAPPAISVSPELDHLVQRCAGDQWPSGDRAGEVGVDADSTQLERAPSPAGSLALQFRNEIFYPGRTGVARPIPFLFSDFLFSDNAAPATNGRQAIAPAR
jgi:hypothetical protein